MANYPAKGLAGLDVLYLFHLPYLPWLGWLLPLPRVHHVDKHPIRCKLPSIPILKVQEPNQLRYQPGCLKRC